MEDEKVTVVEVVPPPTTPKDNKEAKAGYWFQSLLPSVEDVFKWAPFQLPVTMSKEQRQGIVNKSLFPPTMLLSVQDVLRWAFLFSCLVAVSILVSMIPIPCSKSSWLFRCTYLTPAQEVEVESFGEGFLWLTVPQAAAAVVGLLLPRRHAMSRWLLAFLAIISATVVHYMIARMALIFIASNPGDIVFRVLGGGGAIVYLAGDLLGLISLIIRGPEHE